MLHYALSSMVIDKMQREIEDLIEHMKLVEMMEKKCYELGLKDQIKTFDDVLA